MFVNEVEMYNASMEEEEPIVFEENDPLFKDDPLFRFTDHLEGEEGELMDVDEGYSSTVAHAGWDADGELSPQVAESLREYHPEEEDNVAGPSRSFRNNSF